MVAIPKPDVGNYRRHLEWVCNQLSPTTQKAQVCGTDIAQFANAQNGNRAVNLSWGDEGIFVELWDGEENVRDIIEPS